MIKRNLEIYERKKEQGKQIYGQTQQAFPLLEFSKLYEKFEEKIITLIWLKMYTEKILKTIISGAM